MTGVCFACGDELVEDASRYGACATCRTFGCERCGIETSWDQGCADAYPGVCDRCWVELQTKGPACGSS